MIPIRPAVSGIAQTAVEVVCRITFSVMVRGVELRKLGKSLKAAYPRRLDCRDIIEIQPVCRPKYMLVKASRLPMMMPAKVERNVKDCEVVVEGS